MPQKSQYTVGAMSNLDEVVSFIARHKVAKSIPGAEIKATPDTDEDMSSASPYTLDSGYLMKCDDWGYAARLGLVGAPIY